MTSVLGFFKRVYTIFNPPVAQPLPDSEPIKFGILGAAAIAPDALINPAKSHPEAVVYAVAARNKERADAFAKKHGIGKAYGGPNGYQELLDDPEIDAIYNPLPNGLHFEWTMKALAAGKHVLLEKPSANTAEETRQMFEFAEKKGLVLLEAFHYRFHPAAHRVKQILESGELGAIKSISTKLEIFKGFVKPDDIRFNYSIGGGALMDMGCYTISSARYFAGANPTSVLSASHEIQPPTTNVDRRTTATLAFPSSVVATISCDLAIPPHFGFIPVFPRINALIECEGGEVDMMNYIMPTLYHSITVKTRDPKSAGGKGRKTRVEKVYTFTDGEGKGEPWWTTYRYQLEEFVNKLKGRPTRTWVTKEDSIANMECIESIYAKTGVGSRPKSDFILESQN